MATDVWGDKPRNVVVVRWEVRCLIRMFFFLVLIKYLLGLEGGIVE